MPHTRKELLSWAKDAWEKIIGKHPEPEEVTIKGWLARDKDNTLMLCNSRPVKKKEYSDWLMGSYNVGNFCCYLPSELFPSVQWSDEEPTPVTITVKIEK